MTMQIPDFSTVDLGDGKATETTVPGGETLRRT